jgi:hypothetical protein
MTKRYKKGIDGGKWEREKKLSNMDHSPLHLDIFYLAMQHFPKFEWPNMKKNLKFKLAPIRIESSTLRLGNHLLGLSAKTLHKLISMVPSCHVKVSRTSGVMYKLTIIGCVL